MVYRRRAKTCKKSDQKAQETMKKSLYILPLVMLSLAACEGNSVRNTLGLKRNSPDEFMVISRPPLSMPPDFNLRPPGSGPTNEAPQISQEAKKVILDPMSTGSTTKAAKTKSASQDEASSKGVQVLLDKTGASSADPNIRSVLDSESKVYIPDAEEEEDKGFFKSLHDSLTPDKKDPLVDIDKEEERLIKNAQEGKPASEGDIPLKDNGKKSLLNDWLGL
ncbi:MAG: DUF3035 domain-containing protein [Proteobacteria bacterium]|nr:DUF3035 domain-containing protein [Pseudomonadota bacterium]